MSKRLVWTGSDGRVHVLSVSPNSAVKHGSEDAALQAAQARIVQNDPSAKHFYIGDVSELPRKDNRLREAWRQNGPSAPVIDMVKARQQRADRIDAYRRKSARELLEREMLGEDVAAEKATIRNINSQMLVAGASTPDELVNIWPQGLKRPEQ